MHSPRTADQNLINEDLAPVPSDKRTWSMWSYAALWTSMAACIPTYMLASSLITAGMNWWQAVLTVFLGNVIVLIPMMLNAHAGTKYGIPFPVYCRASFGTLGANLPALLRALVACGWFGIQTWIGGDAIHKILTVFMPSLAKGTEIPFLGITGSQLACFLFFWSINMWVIYRGIHTIRLLLSIKAPLLVALGLLLLWWAYNKAGGFGPMLAAPSAFDPGQPQEGKFLSVFIPSLTGMVGFWATLSLNIPDFSRYARSQKDQMLGQAIGLPATMALYSFIGVAVTSATLVIFKDIEKPLWDPVQVLTRFTNPVVLVVSMLAICVATLATNIAANVVSPANDFANVAPKKISFRTGGFITGIIGVLMMPWKLLALPSGYIFTWLVGYSALLGPIAGIMIADYFVIRRCKLNTEDLYRSEGIYRYHSGFSYAGIAALLLAALPCLPGFLVQIGVVANTHPTFTAIYQQAWFVGFVIAFVLYLVFRKLSPTAIKL
ncbi:MAG: NCS1 family nucleobase:cation symporter-1 [Luteolibacter sp.]|uniref:NCS1 family nucleobase:cation symporter-1 n=1 Tax=Luteolibacter sp. TaxID=1962973 RepID=UPI003266DA43